MSCDMLHSIWRGIMVSSNFMWINAILRILNLRVSRYCTRDGERIARNIEKNNRETRALIRDFDSHRPRSLSTEPKA